VSIPLEVRL